MSSYGDIDSGFTSSDPATGQSRLSGLLKLYDDMGLDAIRGLLTGSVGLAVEPIHHGKSLSEGAMVRLVSLEDRP